MNEIDISFQALYNYMYLEIAPIIIGVLFIIFILFIPMSIFMYGLGISKEDRIWKNNIENHMDKVYKDELIERNEKIKTYEKALKECEEENRELRAAVERMKNLTRGL